MYDGLRLRQALLSHVRAAHAGTMPLPKAATYVRSLAEVAEIWADPIAPAMLECADAFDDGDLCTVIVPSLQAVVAVDDAAVPTWRQSEGEMIVYLEADARRQCAEDERLERERFPGFPKSR